MDSSGTIDLGLVHLTVKAELLKGERALGVLARALYSERRARDEAFKAKPFAEPSWDILLDLFAAEHEGRKASVSDVAFAASIPLTTALRHMDQLEAQGLILRLPTKDKRRADLQLTDDARSQMADALTRILTGRTGQSD